MGIETYKREEFQMKFKQLTGAALTAGTVLSILAPATSTFAATPNGSEAANGGTALPMGGGHDTTVGISFGKNDPNGNDGYLRLQYVPYTLDFGNHKVFNGQFPTFNANGLNKDNNTNNVSLGYEGNASTSETNKTDTFNSNVKDLTDFNPKTAGTQVTNKHAWVTVVDKQQQVVDLKNQTATDASQAGADGKNGTWTLNVKSNAELTGKKSGAITGAKLVLGNTAYKNTQDVFGLTGEDQDKDYAQGTGSIGKITPENDINLNLDSQGTYVKVAKAEADNGAGANVFAWNHDDIQLTLPRTQAIQNDVYTTNLSWQLSSDM